MAKFRIQPCKNYVCNGECLKGRAADYNGYCQHCNLYVERAHIKTENLKKTKLYNIKEKENLI